MGSNPTSTADRGRLPLQLINTPRVYVTRVPIVPFVIVPGGGHQGSVWRAALGPMLSWMTPRLAQQAAKADAAAATAAARAAVARKAHAAKPRPPHTRVVPKKP